MRQSSSIRSPPPLPYPSRCSAHAHSDARKVASLPDLDGNGFRDLAIGAPEHEQPVEMWSCPPIDPCETGGIYLTFLGPGAEVRSYRAVGFTETVPIHPNEGFGSSVAHVGDVNGDGVRQTLPPATCARFHEPSRPIALGVRPGSRLATQADRRSRPGHLHAGSKRRGVSNAFL